MNKQPTRTRLRNYTRDLRTTLNRKLNEAAGEWFKFIVTATDDHIADRILDRSHSIKKSMQTIEDMMHSLGDHYACSIIKIAESDNTQMLTYRVVDGHRLVLPFTVQYYPANPEQEDPRPVIIIRLRTFIFPFEKMIAKGNSILVDYVPPKILFEFNPDTGRREMSRLTRMIMSDDCPDALKVLR